MSAPDSTSRSALVDPDSEREFIGGLLRKPQLVDHYLEHANTADLFRDPQCEDAWIAAMSVAHEGQHPSLSEVRARILDTTHHFGDSNEVMPWLMQMHGQAPATDAEVKAAFDRVLRATKRRTLADVAAGTRDRLIQPGSDPNEVLSGLAQQVAQIEAENEGRVEIVPGDQAVQEAMKDIFARAGGEVPGITTGSKDLDDVLGKLAPGRFVIVAARPAGGKSIVGLDLARAALASGAAAIVFSLEMTRADVMKRMLSAQGSIDTKTLFRGDLTPDVEERLAQAAMSLPWQNLAIVDRPNVNAAYIASVAAQQIRQWRAQGVEDIVVVIDYLQRMDHTVPGKRDMPRYLEVAETCKMLVNTGKQNRVPVVALAQVGRDGADRPPQLRDLRESGDIEQEADQVIMLDRPSTRNPEERPGEIDFHIAKNRHGPATMSIPRAAQFHMSRVTDMTRDF